MSVLIIGIAGPSAGGKTSLTQKIEQSLEAKQVVMIKYDDYYKNQDHLEFEQRLQTNYDHPNAFDTELLIQDLTRLKQGETIDKPIYDFTKHTRKKEVEQIEAKKVIIVEGIFTLLDEKLRSLLDIKLYTSEDSDICFIRRLQRDTKERGRSIESVINQYISTVKPMQEKFVTPTQKFADIIILRAKENEIALKMIIDRIKKELEDKE